MMGMHSRSSSGRTVAPPNSPAGVIVHGGGGAKGGKRSSSGSIAMPLALRPTEEMDEDGDAAQVEVVEVAVSEGEESMELKEYAVVGRGSKGG